MRKMNWAKNPRETLDLTTIGAVEAPNGRVYVAEEEHGGVVDCAKCAFYVGCIKHDALPCARDAVALVDGVAYAMKKGVTWREVVE